MTGNYTEIGIKMIEVKETTNEKTTDEGVPNLEEIIWGFELARFDSHHPEYHLLPADVLLLREQYEAFLTDPRRI